jgi:c-di-AMP phosphodiesterase-like protein
MSQQEYIDQERAATRKEIAAAQKKMRIQQRRYSESGLGELRAKKDELTNVHYEKVWEPILEVLFFFPAAAIVFSVISLVFPSWQIWLEIILFLIPGVILFQYLRDRIKVRVNKDRVRELEEEIRIAERNCYKPIMGVPTKVPSKYMNTNALSKFSRYLNEYRANNLTECIRLYEEEKREMEKLEQMREYHNNVKKSFKELNENVEELSYEVTKMRKKK